MSLLIKALEKAEKDRQENAGAVPAPNAGIATPATQSAASDLTLEPFTPTPTNNARAQEDVAISSLMRAQTPSAKPVLSSHASPQAAATVIRASQKNTRKPQSGALAWVSDNPRTLFFSLVGAFVGGYGIYLYLQITHPAWFIKRAPVIAAAPAPAPIIITSAPRTDVAPIATTTPVAPMQMPASASATTPPVHRTHKTVAAAAPEPTTANTNATNAGIATATPNSANNTETNSLDSLLAQAWNALNAGNLATAQQLYGQAQTRDPNNTDVYLGLASIASQQGDIATATRDYMKVLGLDPRNAPAQAGLLSLLGSADPAAAETRLKQLIAQTPSPFLYSTLGNTYANQNRWAEAQQAYFEAYNRKPDNADYAYNLAVALEHINQPALAKSFYQRALDLSNSSLAHFDSAAVHARLQKLSNK